MTPSEKYQTLVERLYRKTIARDIGWSFQEGIGAFATIAGRMIILSAHRSATGNPLEVVQIKNQEGKTIDRFDDEDIRGEPPADMLCDGYWALMKNLREIAVRQAVGADDAIDDILGELDDDVPF
ncbi:MAG: hypothetical protein ACOY5R_11445 [Pseudomonadota bacterium]